MLRKMMQDKINICFIGLLLLMLVAGISKKNVNIESNMVSWPDSQVEFSTEDDVIEQTWAPHVKKIVQLKVPFRAENSFQGIMEARIVSDDYENEIGKSILTYDFSAEEEGELTFSFDTMKVQIGTRYRFQVRFLEESQNGKIFIPTEKESYGCSINGKDIGEAVDFKVVSEKNSRTYWMMSSFLPFIFVAFFLAVIFERKIEETIGMAFVTNAMLLFGFGLFEVLETGIVAVLITGIVCLLIALILCWKKKININDYFTPGVLFYGLMMMYVMVTCHDLVRREWDEYSHWGLAVKDMFYYNTFAKHLETTVWLPRYPTFTTLIEYFFMYNNEIFSEGILYVAYLALMYSFLTVIFKKCVWKNVSNIFTTVVIVLLLPMVFFEHYYFIYVDLMLGIIFAYVLICYFSEELTPFNVLRICGGLMALVLTKDIGLVLAGMFVIAVAIDLVYKNIRNKVANWRKVFTQVGIFAIATVFSFLIWQIYITSPVKESKQEEVIQNTESFIESQEEIIQEVVVENHTENQEEAEVVNTVSSAVSDSGISIEGILELFQGNAPEYRYDVVKNYIRTLFVSDTWEIGKIGFSYVFGIMSIILVSAYLYIQGKNINYIRFFGMSIVISVGYTTFLLITYLFSFTYEDALSLHSHNRYFASCIGGIMIAFWSLIIFEKRERNTKASNFLLTVVCSILLVGVPIGNLNPENLIVYITPDKIHGFDEIEIMGRCIADRKESIYYVYNDSRNGALEQFVFRNYISPVKSTGATFYATEEAMERERDLIELNSEKDRKSVSRYIKTVEQWEEELKGYDYVFIHQTGYVFTEYYHTLFADPTAIGDKTFYRVENDDDTVQLHYMGTVKY